MGGAAARLVGSMTIHTYMHACVHTGVYVHTHTHTHTRTHTHTHARTHTHAHTHAHKHTRKHTRTHVLTHTRIHTHTSPGLSSCPAISLIFSQCLSLSPGLNRACTRGSSSLNSSTRALTWRGWWVGRLSCPIGPRWWNLAHLGGHGEGAGLLGKALLQLVQGSPEPSYFVLHLIGVHPVHWAIHP